MPPTLAIAVYLLLQIVAGVGCALLLHAGASEARGELEHARRVVRRGGFLTSAAALAAAAWTPWLAAALPPVGAAMSAGLGLLAGFAALLAGLSGKPRPGGHAAVLLWTLGVGAGVASWTLSR